MNVIRSIPADSIAFDTAEYKRKYIDEFCRMVVPASAGNAYHDFVTQKRHVVRNYSSCGDLWNCVPWILGCTNPSIINRDDPETGLIWKSGKNISLTYNGAIKCSAWKSWNSDIRGLSFSLHRESFPDTGDMMLIGKYPDELEHVFVIENVYQSEGKLFVNSYDYGQFSKGAKCSLRISREWRQNRLYSSNGNSRAIIGWIDITKIPLDRLAVDLTQFRQG